MPLKGYKYRIYPNEQQQVLICRTFGCARFVFNRMLSESKAAYTGGTRFSSRNDFNRRLTSLKKDCPWLCEVDSTALTAANDNLADAFSRFFKHLGGFPVFRKKKFSGSYTSKCVNSNIRLTSGKIRLPKLGNVKIRLHRTPPDKAVIKSATVSRESDGSYYVSVLFEYEKAITPVPVSDNAIGLDYASDGLYVDDSGNKGTNHKYFRESQDKLAKEQRRLSRKTGSRKGEAKSHNFYKQLRKVEKLHRHIANQRLDNLHKISAGIANRYDVACAESLNMRVMSNKGFGNGKATLDNGYGLFLDMLQYKLADRGKYFVRVDKWFPSSQICHSCGMRHPEMKDLKIRTITCSCGLCFDRDRNAAINIRREGLRILKTTAV